MTEERWEIAWSHQVEGRVGAIACLGEDSLIAAGSVVAQGNVEDFCRMTGETDLEEAFVQMVIKEP